MALELIEKEGISSRIPLKERMIVQRLIMEIIMKRDNLSDDDMLDWADKHSKDISDVIDDPKNELIRSSIFSDNYQIAAEETIKLLKK